MPEFDCWWNQVELSTLGNGKSLNCSDIWLRLQKSEQRLYVVLSVTSDPISTPLETLCSGTWAFVLSVNKWTHQCVRVTVGVPTSRCAASLGAVRVSDMWAPFQHNRLVTNCCWRDDKELLILSTRCDNKSNKCNRKNTCWEARHVFQEQLNCLSAHIREVVCKCWAEELKPESSGCHS